MSGIVDLEAKVVRMRNHFSRGLRLLDHCLAYLFFWPPNFRAELLDI